jgi:hypothetical protein
MSNINIATIWFPKAMRPCAAQSGDISCHCGAVADIDMHAAGRKFGEHMVRHRRLIRCTDVQCAARVH